MPYSGGILRELRVGCALCVVWYTYNFLSQLKRAKLNVGTMDLRIAAIVLEKGGVVVKGNQRDFGRIPALTLEDWSQ